MGCLQKEGVSTNSTSDTITLKIKILKEPLGIHGVYTGEERRKGRIILLIEAL